MALFRADPAESLRTARPFSRSRAAANTAGAIAIPKAPPTGYASPVGALSNAELAAMAEDATIDCYGMDEQAMGFHTMIMDKLKVPFVTSVLGVEVTVEDIDLAYDGSILAICARDGIRQAIRVVDLPLSVPPPAGADWIEAYRYWLC
jgi:hypothetical protein